MEKHYLKQKENYLLHSICKASLYNSTYVNVKIMVRIHKTGFKPHLCPWTQWLKPTLDSCDFHIATPDSSEREHRGKRAAGEGKGAKGSGIHITPPQSDHSFFTCSL